jgi:pyruvate dehydrogenase E1 component
VLAELVKLEASRRKVLTEAIERYDLDFERIPFFGQPGETDDVTR